MAAGRIGDTGALDRSRGALHVARISGARWSTGDDTEKGLMLYAKYSIINTT